LREVDVARRCTGYRDGEKLPNLLNQTVITVDDGTFTGATFVAAVQSIRKLGARYLVGGLPVAAEEAVARIRPLTDELVVLLAPAKIDDLRDYYDDLMDLKEADITNCLSARAKAIAGIARRTA
jgi:predicted phosphoribosyltransferase